MLKHLLRNQRGNTAVLFILFAPVGMMMIGSAIDISITFSSKVKLQAAVDAAILDTASRYKKPTESAKDAADKSLQLSLKDTEISDLQTSLNGEKTAIGDQLNYTATAKQQTYFMKFIGVGYLNVKGAASAIARSQGAEVVFVLDTTASMAENSKITSLKSAVGEALNLILDEDGKNSDGIKVGVVPFNTQVKVAPSSSYAWVNYGQAQIYQYCDYLKSGVWPQCPIYWYNVDALCYDYAAGSADRNTCEANSKVYDKSYSSGANYYYDQYVKSYVPKGGGGYDVRIHRILYTWTNSTWTLTGTDETGPKYAWVGGTSSFASEQNLDVLNTTNLSDYNSVPSGGYKANPKTGWIYDARYSTSNKQPYVKYGDNWFTSGYGAKAMQTYTYTAYNSVKRRKVLPAAPDYRSQWAGCLIDRNQNYDVLSTPYTSANLNTQYIARPCDDEPLDTVLGLTDDIDTVRTKVNALQTAGYTNITIGMQMGLEVLSNPEPYTGGVDFGDKEYGKYMILVTDGYNNKNRFTSTVADIDARTAKVCQEAKDKKVTVFVIRLEEGNSELLKSCATTPPYYYDLSSSTQLKDTLQSVFSKINELRLTK
ncbi:vWA domain-containing protein [Pseudaquidulcibacter saccharophilus]|uniref:vWA domain-containing protein n=1 Tax=Pseudaquidulcibacter saccharophilus TaxID=2831900 RepID=UPI001EFF02A8|nr:TadE/TadG family type IV pilus assembly protein [Pseudaquidulcibacter saccharophilus]